jgi:hypothetical protein
MLILNFGTYIYIYILGFKKGKQFINKKKRKANKSRLAHFQPPLPHSLFSLCLYCKWDLSSHASSSSPPTLPFCFSAVEPAHMDYDDELDGCLSSDSCGYLSMEGYQCFAMLL